jgi:hypothetical protein
MLYVYDTFNHLIVNMEVRMKACMYLLTALFIVSSGYATEITLPNPNFARKATSTTCTFTSSVQEFTFNCYQFGRIEVVPGDQASTMFDCILDYWNGSAWVLLADDNGLNSRFPNGCYNPTSGYPRYRVRPYSAGATGKINIIYHEFWNN